MKMFFCHIMATIFIFLAAFTAFDNGPASDFYLKVGLGLYVLGKLLDNVRQFDSTQSGNMANVGHGEFHE